MIEGRKVAIDLGKYALSLTSDHDPWELIESGALFIRTKGGTLLPFTPKTMKPGQLRAYTYIKKECRAGRSVQVRWLKYRQGGFSTLAEAIIFSNAVCKDYQNALVLSNVEDTATWIYGMSQTFQAEMESRGTAWANKRYSNRQEIVWYGSESRIRIGSAQSKNIGITETRQLVHLSEVAYYPNWTVLWGNLSPSIPTHLPGCIVIMESTANGAGDHFHQGWLQGERGEGSFKNFFFSWTEDPDYTLPVPPGFEITEQEQELKDALELTDGQVWWRRCKINDEFAGDLQLFNEKFPSTAEEAFRSTGSIVHQSIKSTLHKIMVTSPSGERGTVEKVGDRGISFRPHPEGIVEVFKGPKRGHEYAMYSDVGEGLKNVDTNPVYLDGKKITTTYSTCVVRDKEDWSLCAILECRYPTDVFSQVAQTLGEWYNQALWGIEIPGPGHAVIAWARANEYKNLYRREWRDANNDFRQMTEYGYRNDIKTKPQMEMDWEAFVRDYPELLGSARIAAQAITLIQNERTGKHGPKAGCFSDILLADYGDIQMLKSYPKATKEAVRKKIKDYQKQTSKKQGSYFR